MTMLIYFLGLINLAGREIMNGRVLKIGAILFFAGVALALFSVSVNPNFHGSEIVSSAGITHDVNGLYAVTLPDKLTSTAPSSVTISYNGTIQHFALVNSSIVSGLNETNYVQYNLSKAVLSQDQISYNELPAGNYTFIETQNITEAIFIAHISGIELAGYTGTTGLYLAIIGFLTLIAGAVIKPKKW